MLELKSNAPLHNDSNPDQPRQMLVTCALPYANGPIHLGHLIEYIQADIWVRWHKLTGQECWLVCADDAHGTAIMLKADEHSITPETLIASVKQAHMKSFDGFLIDFDHYHSTHSAENKQLSEFIFQELDANGLILTKTIEQLYDAEKELFLADRFVKGQCPKCGAPDQYGDNCEVCGATYDATELVSPVSSLSGNPPILRSTQQLYFNVAALTDFLSNWTQSGALQPEMANKLNEWLSAGLEPWDISRQAPYFGFPIPNHPDKFFYVWLDAPIGYIASFKALCDHKTDIDFEHYWRPPTASVPSTELYHFIGKDIINFHGLFWPAMLKTAGFRLPNKVFVHGFVTVNGEKMSKSKGTFIQADTYLEHLPAECLRYYFACKITPHVEDTDLNLEDFQQRINSDLVGKYINLASRCSGFIHKKFEGILAEQLADQSLFDVFTAASNDIQKYYEAREYSKAMRLIMQLADQANQYIDREAPWKKAKEADLLPSVQGICSQGINLFRLLTLYLKPVLPNIAQQVEDFLNIPPLTWEDRHHPLLQHTIDPFKPLMQRITDEQLTALQANS